MNLINRKINNKRKLNNPWKYTKEELELVIKICESMERICEILIKSKNINKDKEIE